MLSYMGISEENLAFVLYEITKLQEGRFLEGIFPIGILNLIDGIFVDFHFYNQATPRRHDSG